MNTQDVFNAVKKCRSVGELSGLLSTQNFANQHPEKAQDWVLAILTWSVVLWENRECEGKSNE